MANHHRAIAITSSGVIDQIDLPTPSPAANEVLYEVHYAGLMPADVYQIDKGFFVQEYPSVIGVSSAGYVKAVGEGVTDIKVGDKVAGVNFPASKNKALQDVAVLPRPFIAKIPQEYNLAEAATLPDNWVSAAFTLFGTPNLGLPLSSSFPPTSPPNDADQPILVHGGGSSSGQYVIQLFHLAGYTQVYATASPQNHSFLKELGAKQVFDYRSPRLAEEILEATGGKKVSIVVDSISSIPSIKAYSPILGKGSRLAAWYPIKRGSSVVNEQDDFSGELVPEVQKLAGDATLLMIATMAGLPSDPASTDLLPKLLPQLLEKGIIRPNRVRLFKESDGPLLERVKTGLSLIRDNKLSGEKVVIELKAN